MVKFEAKLKAGIKWDEDAKVYVTFAPALGLYSQGANKIQAKAALDDAVNSFLIVAYKKNVLNSILNANGCVRDIRPIDELRSSDEQYIVVERILEQQAYEDVFEVRAELLAA